MNLSNNSVLQNGKYHIVRVLGQGGFGITYLAEHTMLDKMVAIKEFFPKEYCDRDENTSHLTIGTKNSVEIVEMLKTKFIKEARNISRLRHKNIITIHDIFEENDTAYYVMEYVEGESLSQIVKKEGALSENRAVGYIRKIGDAVGYMHSLSMNHLDLKPANIMVRTVDDEPILIDFGLSKQYDASGGQTSTTPVGISHGYAPIEQYRPGGVATFSPQTDIYALGATLFALLSGTTPPHYSDIIEEGLADLPATVNHETIVAIEKAMEMKRTKRPSSVEEFLGLLPNIEHRVKIETEVVLKTSTPNINSKEDSAIEANSLKFSEDEDNPKFCEETVILNVPLAHNILTNKEDKQVVETQDDLQSEMRYLDLGLSVKWATKLSGIALPTITDNVYEFKLDNGEIVLPQVFVETHQLPTIKHFEELIERCSWSTFSENGMHGYKIIGPNGNILMMPLGVLNHYLTADCLTPDRLYYYFLYLGEYTHTLAKGVPVEANIWTIKE